MSWLRQLRWPKSLRWRYSLRALLVFVTLFMLWGGYHTNHSWKERAAEEVLRKHGIGCSYGPTKVGTGIWSDVQFGYQKVIQAIWRVRFITDVKVYSPPEAEVLDAIVALPYLESLTLAPARNMTAEEQRLLRVEHRVDATIPLPGGALERVLAQHELKSLWVAGWILSDRDCQAIAEHRTLEGLNLYGSSLSEEGFAEMLTLPRLRHLTLSYCQVSGRKLATISGSTTLELIECQYAPIGIEFAAFVGRSPNISTIRCYHKNIDDDFVRAIGAHPSMEDLNLGHTKLTNRGVAVLGKMPSLKYATIASMNVTAEAKAALQKANPTIKLQ